MSDWIRLELGRPTVGGFVAGALFAAAPASIPALILGWWAWPTTVVLGALAGAFTLRRGGGIA